MVKSDCFAYGNDGCNPYCTACNPSADGSMPCRYGNKCRSYKTREAYEQELMRINGTTDMAEIIATYSSADTDKRIERWIAIVRKAKGESNG